MLLVHVRQLRQLGPLVVAQEARQVVVVPRVIQLMAPRHPGVVVPRVPGSPICHMPYEQVEGPPLLEPVG